MEDFNNFFSNYDYFKDCLKLEKSANEIYSVVSNALGVDWLNKSVKNVDSSRGIPVYGHRVGQLFSIAGKSQIIEIYELYLCLTSLLKVKNFNDVIHGLKDNYEHSFLQLGLALRLLLIGGEIIEFEPINAKGGKSDILIKYEGKTFMLECYTPTIKSNEQYEFLAKGILKSLEKDAGLLIEIKFNQKLTLDNRKKVQANILQQLGKAQTIKESVSIKDDVFSCVITHFNRGIPDKYVPQKGLSGYSYYLDSDICWLTSSVTKESLERIKKDKEVAPIKHINGIIVWKPKSEKASTIVADFFDKALKKIEKKISQTKSEENYQRIIAVMPNGLPDSDLIRLKVNDINSKLSSKHQPFTMLFLKRQWTVKNRYQTTGYIVGNSKSKDISSLLKKLNKLESGLVF